ncbi:hypothetical protein [Acidipila sp. EB88]|uniref:hypothetical protein n=1 Tax=Acidipila sp. EB88 TaxID=2305226 RepID=UPI000F5D64B5|nr:hypothetical protein [Acidipila sp. EB88]
MDNLPALQRCLTTVLSTAETEDERNATTGMLIAMTAVLDQRKRIETGAELDAEVLRELKIGTDAAVECFRTLEQHPAVDLANWLPTDAATNNEQALHKLTLGLIQELALHIWVIENELEEQAPGAKHRFDMERAARHALQHAVLGMEN